MEAKKIKGHGLGTIINWLCVEHKNEGFGFGNEEAITCIDMTNHAPEHGHPHTVFSTYKQPTSRRDVEYKIIKGAYHSPEQIEMAHNIINNWDKIKSGELIELDKILRLRKLRDDALPIDGDVASSFDLGNRY